MDFLGSTEHVWWCCFSRGVAFLSEHGIISVQGCYEDLLKTMHRGVHRLKETKNIWQTYNMKSKCMQLVYLTRVRSWNTKTCRMCRYHSYNMWPVLKDSKQTQIHEANVNLFVDSPLRVKLCEVALICCEQCGWSARWWFTQFPPRICFRRNFMLKTTFRV